MAITLPPRRRRQGFTLVELIVVILVLGVLAAIGIVGYDQVTARAQAARARVNLQQIAQLIVTDATANGLDELSRAETLQAMAAGANVTVNDGLAAAGTWYLGHAGDVPAHADEFAIGFDNGDTVANDTSGTEAVLLTSDGSGTLYAQAFALSSSTSAGVTAGTVPAGTTPAAVIANPSLITAYGNAGQGHGGGSATPVNWTTGALTSQKLWGADETNNAAFGGTMSISGGTLVIGTESQDTAAGPSAGAAYVYTQVNGTWTQQAELFAPHPVAYGYFGMSVAISGNVLAIADGDIPEQGDQPGVRIYTGAGSTWTLQDTIVAPGGSSSFGYPIALDGNNLAVAAPSETGLAPQSGAVYLYHQSGSHWVQEARLIAPDGAYVGSTSEQFGGSLALQGDTVVVGAPWKNNGEGAVYVADRASSGTWTISHEFSAASGVTQLGRAVGYDQDHLVASAGSGLVQAWTRTAGTWAAPAVLTSSQAGDTDFGWGVAVHGSTLAVTSSSQTDPTATGPATTGVTTVFSLNAGSWTRARDLYSADPNWAFGYGQVVVIDNGVIATAAVGGVGDSTKSLFSGHVTVSMVPIS